jgi:hypothetical protein
MAVRARQTQALGVLLTLLWLVCASLWHGPHGHLPAAPVPASPDRSPSVQVQHAPAVEPGSCPVCLSHRLLQQAQAEGVQHVPAPLVHALPLSHEALVFLSTTAQPGSARAPPRA